MIAAGPINRGGSSLWFRRFIQEADTRVRRQLGVAEFTGERECILRIALILATEPMTLADGAVIEPGDPVIELHFWNEHLFLNGVRGIGFGAAVHRRLVKSLGKLARAMRADPALGEAKAVCAHMASALRHDGVAIDRFVARFGFEAVLEARPRPLKHLVDDAWLWGLTFAFRPHTLRRRPLLRHHFAVWISRAAFEARFGAA